MFVYACGVRQYRHYSRISEFDVLRSAAFEDIAVQVFAMNGYVSVFAFDYIEAVSRFHHIFGYFYEIVQIFCYDVACIYGFAAQYANGVVLRNHLWDYGAQFGVVYGLNHVGLYGIAAFDFEYEFYIGDAVAVHYVAYFVILHGVDSGIASFVVFAAYGVLMSGVALRDVYYVYDVFGVAQVGREGGYFDAFDFGADVGVNDLFESFFGDYGRVERSNCAGQGGFALLFDFAQTEDYGTSVGVGHGAYVFGEFSSPVFFAVEVYSGLVFERGIFDHAVVDKPLYIFDCRDFHSIGCF